MPDKNIFCNVPWYDLHIYWDGSFGVCCAEDHKAYSESNKKYNITEMSISDWFNSEPIKQFRTNILRDTPLSACRMCYLEEAHGGHSRRLKGNQKSVIFSRAFEESFKQSPGHHQFEHSEVTQGFSKTMPIDLHINLGNFCNLACKMCSRDASTTIASQEVSWGLAESRKYLGVDWTRNADVWHSFKQQLLDIPGLNNIHFMGGETLLTDRIDDLVDTMIANQRFDLSFSFVTNGTVFKSDLMDKLKLFKRVGIEVSIETVTEHNAYQRQGTDTGLVLANLKRYQDYCNGSSITVTLRPALSLLTIGYYHTLLEYALSNQLLIKSNLCYKPKFLYAINLPTAVKQMYAEKYHALLAKLQKVEINNDFNASDPNNFGICVKQEAKMCLDLLNSPEPLDLDLQLANMVQHCRKWDMVYGYDARTLYPELMDVWNAHGY